LSEGAIGRGTFSCGEEAVGDWEAGGGFTFGTGAGGGSWANTLATLKTESANAAAVQSDLEIRVFRGLFIFSQPNSYSFLLVWDAFWVAARGERILTDVPSHPM